MYGGDLHMARNKYPEITVEKILEVSQRLFLTKGYDNTTIQDIVDELGGLTRGAIYHHFKSKEEIMDALTNKMFHEKNPFIIIFCSASCRKKIL
jgi:AcrR family transcriptional regulator